MRSRILCNVGFAVAALALPALSLAQAPANSPEQIDEVRKEASAHLGPFYVTPKIFLKELGVDSNVFNTAGEAHSDFTTTVSPVADVWLPVARRALFQISGATDLVWYANFASERSIDPQVAARAELYLRRITVFVDGEYLNSRQRLNYEIDLRARHVAQNATAGVALRLSPKVSVEAAVRRDELRFDADARFDGVSLQRMLNQQTTGFSVAARHRVTPLTTLAVRYERIEDEFPYAPARDSRSFRIMPGIEFKPRALIKGSAYVGYREFTPAIPSVLPEFNGLVAQLGLSYTLLGSTEFGVTYRRDLTYSYEELQPFFINNSVGASVRRALGRRFDVLVSVDRHRYTYENLLLGPADGGLLQAIVAGPTLDPRVDTTWNYSGSLGYRIGGGRMGFGVAYLERDSPRRAYRTYDNLRFGTTVTYGF